MEPKQTTSTILQIPLSFRSDPSKSIPTSPPLSTPTHFPSPPPPQSSSPMEQAELRSIPATPPEIRTPASFLSPIGTPMKRVLVHLKGYLEEVGHLTKLDPRDSWLPITESRNGNAHYAAFHSLNAGIGFQALLLPVAFGFLGWSWGILSLTIAYCWQLYTLWILVQLHEAVPGKRYNRYVELAEAASLAIRCMVKNVVLSPNHASNRC